MEEKCEYCNTSFNEILDNGFAGCEHCYQQMPALRNLINSMFKGKKHNGRKPRRQYGDV